MATKNAEDFELVAEMPADAKVARVHVDTLEDKVVKALLDKGENAIAKIKAPEDVDKMRRDFRYAAYRVDRSATTRVSEGFVFVKLTARRRVEK